VRVTLVRGPTPDGKTWNQTYDLPDLAGASISNVLQHISRHIDGSVAYYLSCRRGLCAACVVRIKGQNEMACITLAYDGIVIEPTNQRLLIKDTVVHLGMPRESEFDISGAAYCTSGPADKNPA
jgi:succinate dehydrogenase/fumarate reductase-like Fe-S protein